MLVLTGMNFEEQDKLYDQAKASLKKFMSEFNSKNDTAIKFDPAFLAEHEEACMGSRIREESQKSTEI